MKKETIMRFFSVPTAKGLCGARRVAMMLLMTMLTSIGAWADEIDFLYWGSTPYLNMPGFSTGTKTLNDATITSFKVYDNGGRTGNYYDNSRSTLIITAPEGYLLQLSGQIKTDDNFWDYLTVYDNSEASGTKLIDKKSSTHANIWSDIPTVTSTGRSMTLYFYSNGDGNDEGLDLTVTLIVSEPHDININTATGGSVASNKSTAKVKETVTLTATPQSTYMLTGISVKDGSNKNVGVTWDGPFYNTATFTMPFSDVTVTPTFTNNLTADGGLYINMPKTDSKSLTIPSGVQSFKVYDDGGSTGNYSNNCDGTLVLTAPSGYRMLLSGYIDIYNDYLYVYDGSDNTASELYHKNGGYGSTTVASTGNTMTIYFQSGDADNDGDGLDLTVTVFLDAQYAINGIGNVTGGIITASVNNQNVTSAKAFETVTLTATPQSNHMLTGISVKDSQNNGVGVSWDGPFDNTATFTMPISIVTVTPTFTDNLTVDGGLYVNMPKTDTKTITIPSGVESFKVYDDGGKDGNYSDDCSGTLVLTAPENYVMHLSGSASIAINDNLTVWDGTDTNNESKKLLNAVSSFSHPVTSTGNTMTIYFFSNIVNTKDGLNLTVTLAKENAVELIDNADNSTVINNNHGRTSTVTLSGRTIYKDGEWNTLCLPFSLTAEEIAASPLADFTIKKLNGSESGLAGGTLTLNFEDATTIEAGKPYIVKGGEKTDLIIKNKADWNAFCVRVNDNDETFEGKVVMLADDYDNSGDAITWTVGKPEHPFKGTFDGNGRTLTVGYNTSTDRLAPFRYVDGATIKNLTIAGSVLNKRKLLGGLVGSTVGNTTISNCRVSATVESTVSGDGTVGGFVAIIDNGQTTIENCLFDGSFVGADTKCWSGFVGWVECSATQSNSDIGTAGKLSVKNSLFAPTTVNIKDDSNNCTVYRTRPGYIPKLTNCYYKTTATFGKYQGTDASGMSLLNILGSGWEISGGNVLPKMYVNIINPMFRFVTIDKTAPAPVNFSGGSFVGNYAPLEITDANRNSIVLLAAGNKLGYAKTDRTIANGKALGACRAYFDIPSVAGAPAINSYELNFGEDDENTTGIIEVNTNNTNKAEGVFDLQGRRIANGQKPTAKGLYIVNGKKIVIK